MTPNMLPPSIHNRPPLTMVSWMSPMEMGAFIIPAAIKIVPNEFVLGDILSFALYRKRHPP